MEVVEFINTFTSNYPYLLDILLVVSAIAGVTFIVMAGVYVARMELFQTLSSSQMGYVRVLVLMAIGSLCLALAWTMNLFAETFFDYGGFVLEAFEGTNEWVVRRGLQPTQALQQFAILTCRLIGVQFGLWGLFTAARAQMVDTQATLWGGVVRMFVGAALFNPVGFLDLFGGWGTKYLVS